MICRYLFTYGVRGKSVIQNQKYIKRLGQLIAGCGLLVQVNAFAVTAPRLLHYPLVCNPADQCRIDCFQEGRTILSSVRIEPNDHAVLVLSDGFSDRLKPMWIEVRPGGRRGNRTVLMPPGAFCDMQGITVRPLEP